MHCDCRLRKPWAFTFQVLPDNVATNYSNDLFAQAAGPGPGPDGQRRVPHHCSASLCRRPCALPAPGEFYIIRPLGADACILQLLCRSIVCLDTRQFLNLDVAQQRAPDAWSFAWIRFQGTLSVVTYVAITSSDLKEIPFASITSGICGELIYYFQDRRPCWRMTSGRSSGTAFCTQTLPLGAGLMPTCPHGLT